MGLYDAWKDLAGKDRTQQEYDAFWQGYFEKEKHNYESILENHQEVVSGELAALAEGFGMDAVTMAGFIDGINTSLVKTVDLEQLEETSEVRLEIDFQKLYYNMLDAKADWLYTLPQWEKVLPEETRSQITREFKQSRIAVSRKVGRNDPCPCGSGKKYKKCCGT